MEARAVREISVPSSQFYCKPKTARKKFKKLSLLKTCQRMDTSKDLWFQQKLEKGQFHHYGTALAIMSSGIECRDNKEAATAWRLSECQSSRL